MRPHLIYQLPLSKTPSSISTKAVAPAESSTVRSESRSCKSADALRENGKSRIRSARWWWLLYPRRSGVILIVKHWACSSPSRSLASEAEKRTSSESATPAAASHPSAPRHLRHAFWQLAAFQQPMLSVPPPQVSEKLHYVPLVLADCAASVLVWVLAKIIDARKDYPY